MRNSPSQTIKTPFGVTAFGSAISRIAPEIASLKLSVTPLEQKPADAFAKARQGSQAVRDWLCKARISEFGASMVTLLAQNRFTGGEKKLIGYQATVSFHVVLTELDRMEEVLTPLLPPG